MRRRGPFLQRHAPCQSLMDGHVARRSDPSRGDLMNSRILVVAGFLAAGVPLAARAQQTEVVVAPVVVDGEVIRYEPGRTIVVKSDGREVSYVLTPEVTLPADLQLGRRVSVHTERGAD